MAAGTDPLLELFAGCIVCIDRGGRFEGSGFFVAPGEVLTCAHVVHGGLPLTVRTADGTAYAAEPITPLLAPDDEQAAAFYPQPDAALLRVGGPPEGHPCVRLETVHPAVGTDTLQLTSYTEGENAPGRIVRSGASLHLETLFVQDGCTLYKLREGQVIGGFSGGPLLNMRTGSVCALVDSSRSTTSDLGGFGVPIAAVVDEIAPELLQRNASFHATDPRWTDAVGAQRAAEEARATMGRRAGGRPDQPVVRPVRAITDPFSLEVHPAIEVKGRAALPPLPLYIPREHDARLAQMVSRAVRGQSAIAVLVGGSSVGKTRACWEVLSNLPDDWRVWHPIDPTRPRAAAAAVRRIGPRTVIWLNDAQHYLMPPEAALGERVAAGLRELLRDPERAPVLVLATLWPEYWERLTTPPMPESADPYSQIRELITGSAVRVADRFGELDIDRLRASAHEDERLREAVDHAEDGEITQYLAGAPALVERYLTAPAPVQALIHAAMDARRLGWGPILPRELIETAAPGYLTARERETLPDDWLERAFAYTAAPCRGARGPLSAFRSPPGEPATNEGYRLADYLEQRSQESRAAAQVPASLWDAFLAFAPRNDLAVLGKAAEDRHLYRHAARLHVRAVDEGVLESVTPVARLLAAAGSVDAALAWHDRAADNGESEALLNAAYALSDAGRIDDALEYWQRAWERGEGNRPHFALLAAGRMLARVHRLDEALAWYERAADTDTGGIVWWRSVLTIRWWGDYRPPEGRIGGTLYKPFGGTGSHLAMLDAARRLAKVGRIDEAVEWYERAADLDRSEALICYRQLADNDPETLDRIADWLRGELEHVLLKPPRGKLEPSPATVFRQVAIRGRRQALLHSAQMFLENARVGDALESLQRLDTDDAESLNAAANLLDSAEIAETVVEHLRARGLSALSDALITRLERTDSSRRSGPSRQGEMPRIEGPASILDYEELPYDIIQLDWAYEMPRSRLENLADMLAELRREVDLGEKRSLLRSAALLRASGQREDALHCYLRAAACGGGGYVEAIDLLREWGKPDDAERLRRYGIQPPGQVAKPFGPETIGIGRSADDGAPEEISTITRLLLRRWRDGGNHYGKAVITAAVDLVRCGYDDPLPAELIAAAVRRRQAVGPNDQWLPQALAWAQAPIRDGIAPLMHDDVPGCFRVADALLDGIAAGADIGPIPESIWELVVDRAPFDSYSTICAAAASAGYLDLAERIARLAATGDEPVDLYNLAVILRLRGNVSESADLLRRSADAGEPHALSRLAVQLAEQGDASGAVNYYEQAISAGDVDALVRLALLYLDLDDNTEAERLFWRAVDRGHPVAAHNLAVLVSLRGRVTEAESLFRTAIEAGYGPSVTSLAMHLHSQDREDEAEALYRQATCAGDGAASRHLGVLMESREKFGEALHYYRLAADYGETAAVCDLGNLLEELGRSDEAMEAFRQGVALGDAGAMNGLALILHDRDEGAAAEELYRASIRGGGTSALNNLALLLSERGESDEAVSLYRAAISHGDAGAMNNLALLLAERGEYSEAVSLFTDAIAAGDPKAATNFARLRGESASDRR